MCRARMDLNLFPSLVRIASASARPRETARPSRMPACGRSTTWSHSSSPSKKRPRRTASRFASTESVFTARPFPDRTSADITTHANPCASRYSAIHQPSRPISWQTTTSRVSASPRRPISERMADSRACAFPMPVKSWCPEFLADWNTACHLPLPRSSPTTSGGRSIFSGNGFIFLKIRDKLRLCAAASVSDCVWISICF